jgi:hypothetical protein
VSWCLTAFTSREGHLVLITGNDYVRSSCAYIRRRLGVHANTDQSEGEIEAFFKARPSRTCPSARLVGFWRPATRGGRPFL